MSQLRQPPPIEDLSDISWQRVERDLFAALDSAEISTEPARPSRRGWRWAAGGAIAAVAAAALVLAMGRDGSSEHGTKLSRLVTEGTPSSITVRGAAITAAPHTALLVTESGSGTQVILERGAIDCAIPPQKHRAPFVVVAGDVQISVTGTRFSVARYGDSAEVVVERGEVTILAAGERYQVRAGERWPDKTAAIGDGDEFELYLEDDPVERPARRAKRVKRATPKERVPEPEAETTAPTAKERFAAAARLERSDPTAALAIYRQLAREKAGVWSANALYAQAELELRRGNKAAARKLLQRYLHTYPKGPNAAIARSELRRLAE